MTIKKPKLSLDEQIEHLKDKGILFNIMDESDAKKYFDKILYLIFDYPHKHYTFKHFEV